MGTKIGKMGLGLVCGSFIPGLVREVTRYIEMRSDLHNS